MKRSETKLLEMKAEVLKAAGHPVRLSILEAIADGEKCVCDIAEQVDAKRSNVSRHLSVLLKAGLVECRKEGLLVLYSLRTPCVLHFFSCVESVLRERLKGDRALLEAL